MDLLLASAWPLRVMLAFAPTVLYGIAALRTLRGPALAFGPTVQRMALAAGLAAFLSAGCTLVWGPMTWSGPALVTLGSLGTVRPGVRADFLSSAMLLLISSLGWVIARYSQRYLAGEDALPRYFRSLLATLCAVSLVVISNNLAILLAAWVCTSLALHQLLTFYRDRPQAQLAARKKYLTSRLAEILLAVAFTLIAAKLGTLAIDEVLLRLRAMEELPPSLRVAAILIVLAAALKSAQLPVHGWLIQVMEAPTPVSALLHAGLVNLGGFLLLRLSGLIAQSAEASALLVVLGSLTAGLAALVTLTRISIKVMLAWSTCAQLGFMLVECGLGAYDLALLHLLAHSLYKAYAFLNAGSTVADWRQRYRLPQPLSPSLTAWLCAGGVGIGLVGVAALLVHAQAAQPSPHWLLWTILGLALAPVLLAALCAGLTYAAGASVAILALVALQHSIGPRLSHVAALGPAGHTVPGWAILWAASVFVALFVVQGILLAQPHRLQHLYPWFFGGLFLDDLLTGLGLRLARLGARLRRGRPARRPQFGLMDGSAIPANPREIAAAIDDATRLVAPTWPLDQLIAVNPFCGLGDQPFAAAAAELHLLSGARLLMPRKEYRAAFAAGTLRREHLQDAITESGSNLTVEQLIAGLGDSPETPPRLQLLCDLVDRRDRADALPQGMTWSDYITHSISQFCAAWFDAGQAGWRMPRHGGMYRTWRTHAAADRGPALLLGLSRSRALVHRLPSSPRELIAFVLSELAVPPSAYRSYLAALLLRIGGWAAWCAHARFEARKSGREDSQIVDLLAIRLAWEWLFSRDQPLTALELVDFHAQWLRLEDLRARSRAALHPDCLLQQALERAYQQPLGHDLVHAARPPEAATSPPPAIQAVFCIDVRSEPLRRALEQLCPEVQTLGFAGFFGLPMDYTTLGATRPEPRLPGLLSPQLHAEESCPLAAPGESLRAKRTRRIELGQSWYALRTLASTAFTLVESCGLLYTGKLLASSLHRVPRLDAASSERLRRRPSPPPTRPMLRGGEELATLAEGVLRALGITRDFARLILLCGHGSTTQNNPQAAALQCGACGGHAGDINARVLANLLNAPALRAALRSRGLAIPDSTCFVAGMHDTATDEVQLLDLDLVPSSHDADVASLSRSLSQAAAQNRRRRAESLGVCGRGDAELRQAFLQHASSWAEVRPEWGLLGNACFIAAPRRRTRDLDLAGRAFLHDYDARADESLQKLEQIMTAPMVVAHWISLQYYASTVDPLRYGSGNKVLHNVVGGRLGVFEGNGGDLRIGLPIQCLGDGVSLRHTPLRLSVYIEAPQAAIAAVIARHPQVADLIRHEWLHLFQIDAEGRQVVRYRQGRFGHQPRSSSAEAATQDVAA